MQHVIAKKIKRKKCKTKRHWKLIKVKSNETESTHEVVNYFVLHCASKSIILKASFLFMCSKAFYYSVRQVFFSESINLAWLFFG